MQLHRGLVRTYDSTNHVATVLLAGSMSRTLLNVPVSQQVPPDQIYEGVACAVAFFEDQATALVVATLGVPDPRVVIVDDYDAAETALTTDWQTMPNITVDVAPAEPHSWDTIVIARVHLRSSGSTELYDLFAQIAEDGTRVGQMSQVTIYYNWTGMTVPLYYQTTVDYSDPKTYTLQAKKAGGSYAKVMTLGHILTVSFPKT